MSSEMLICLLIFTFLPTSFGYCGDIYVLNNVRYRVQESGRIFFPSIPHLQSINIGIFSITSTNRSINERNLHKHQALSEERSEATDVLISFDVCDSPDVLTETLLRIYFMMLGSDNTFPVYDLKIFTCVSLQYTVITKSFFEALREEYYINPVEIYPIVEMSEIEKEHDYFVFMNSYSRTRDMGFEVAYEMGRTFTGSSDVSYRINQIDENIDLSIHTCETVNVLECVCTKGLLRGEVTNTTFILRNSEEYNKMIKYLKEINILTSDDSKVNYLLNTFTISERLLFSTHLKQYYSFPGLVTLHPFIALRTPTNCNESLFIDTFGRSKYCKLIQLTSIPLYWVVKFKTDYNYWREIVAQINALKNNNFSCINKCSAGMTLVHRYEQSTNLIRYKCIICPIGSVKEDIGDHECKPCDVIGFKANKQQTKCIDTFHTFSLNFSNYIGLVMLGFCAFGFFLVSIAIYSFMKYKDTPVVKSSNRLLSLVQLFSYQLFFILLPFLFIGEKTSVICFIQPISISILLTIPISLSNVRVHTLVLIFHAKVRISANEMLRVKIMEVFTITLSVLIGILIFCVCVEEKMPKIALNVAAQNRYREEFCDTEIHIVTQLMLAVTLLFYSIVQSFRARKLPSNLKETRVLGAGSILMCIILCNGIWLFFIDDTSYYWKYILTFFVLFTSIFTHFLFQYGHKVFIILLLPQKNTKSYFTMRIQRKMFKTTKKSDTPYN